MLVIRIIFSDHNLIDVYKVTALDMTGLHNKLLLISTSQNANEDKDTITQ